MRFNRVGFSFFAALVLFSHSPSFASECDPLIEAGESKKLKFGKDAQKTTLIGALGGAALGGLLGNITSGEGDKGKGTARGALLGGLLGGAAGLAVGQTAERRRAAFETESAYLDCELSVTREQIAEREKELEETRIAHEQTMSEAEEVKARIASNESTRKERRAMRDKLKDRIKIYDSQLASWQGQIDYLDAVSARLASQGGTTQSIKKRQAELESEKAKLVAQYERIALMQESASLARSEIS